jgi:hypothetical protein
MLSSFVAPYAGGILYDLSAYYPFVIAIIITLVIALLAISELFAEQSTER